MAEAVNITLLRDIELYYMAEAVDTISRASLRFEKFR